MFFPKSLFGKIGKPTGIKKWKQKISILPIECMSSPMVRKSCDTTMLFAAC